MDSEPSASGHGRAKGQRLRIEWLKAQREIHQAQMDVSQIRVRRIDKQAQLLANHIEALERADAAIETAGSAYRRSEPAMMNKLNGILSWVADTLAKHPMAEDDGVDNAIDKYDEELNKVRTNLAKLEVKLRKCALKEDRARSKLQAAQERYDQLMQKQQRVEYELRRLEALHVRASWLTDPSSAEAYVALRMLERQVESLQETITDDLRTSEQDLRSPYEQRLRSALDDLVAAHVIACRSQLDHLDAEHEVDDERVNLARLEGNRIWSTLEQRLSAPADDTKQPTNPPFPD